MRFCVQEWFKEVHAFIETDKFRHISMPDRMHLLLRSVPWCILAYAWKNLG
jgi:hypothetical protein